MMPHAFSAWGTVYDDYYQWNRNGVWSKALDAINEFHRKKDKIPSYCIIDSRSTMAKLANENCGYDGGRKVKGRKRHIIVDTLGNLLEVVVHVANIYDTKFAH